MRIKNSTSKSSRPNHMRPASRSPHPPDDEFEADLPAPVPLPACWEPCPAAACPAVVRFDAEPVFEPCEAAWVPLPAEELQVGVDDPAVPTPAGCAPEPVPAALAWAPQWPTVPFWPSDHAPACPVEAPADAPCCAGLPAEMDIGCKKTVPGGGLGAGLAASAWTAYRTTPAA